MSINVAVIDLSINNIKSIVRSLEILNFKVIVVSKKFDVNEFDLIVLPGVGSFGEGANALKKMD